MVYLIEHDFAQIEHVNQTIQNNLRYDDWECFDTAELLEQYPVYGIYDNTDPKSSSIEVNVKDVRYNSFLVNIDTTTSGQYVYTIEVRNSLWTGEYKISRSLQPTVKHDGVTVLTDKDPNILYLVVNKDYKDIRVCFHFSQIGDGRTINKSGLVINNTDYYEDQYDKSINHNGTITNSNGDPVSGCNVTLTPCNKYGVTITNGNHIPLYPDGLTDTNGVYSLTYGSVNIPDTYYAVITATLLIDTATITATKIVKIDKIQENKRAIDWGNPEQYNTITKGAIHNYTEQEINTQTQNGAINNTHNYIRCITLNKYGVHDQAQDYKLEGTIANVIFTEENGTQHSQTCIADNQGFIYPRISYRKYYEDKSKITIILQSSKSFTDTYSDTKEINHTWYIAENYSQITSECNNKDGTDWIMVKPTNILSNGTPINIKRDQTIAGLTGTQWATIDGNKTNPIKITNNNPETDNHTDLTLLGLKFTNCENAIRQEYSTGVIIDNCYFLNNSHESNNHKGTCISHLATDYAIDNPKLFKTTIRNSYFYNNVGNIMESTGITVFHDNLFKTDQKKYLTQPQPKVVIVLGGSVDYRYNKSHIKIEKPISYNNSFAKALTYIHKKGRFNGASPLSLKKDNSLPIFNEYHNQAYTYCVYYYPYSGINTYIVCNPQAGHERHATGHGTVLKNWIYYDGYHFNRYNNGANKGNTYDPWTKEELAIPVTGGIYDVDKNKFTDNMYDPRLSTYNGDNY